jgi:hypothetical protein
MSIYWLIFRSICKQTYHYRRNYFSEWNLLWYLWLYNFPWFYSIRAKIKYFLIYFLFRICTSRSSCRVRN